jgi:hypothetical protein
MYYVVEDVCGEQEKIVKEFNTHVVMLMLPRLRQKTKA